MIVSVKKGESSVNHLSPVSLEEAGIREVQDLQKWILAKPEVLGEPLLVIDDQFSSFDASRDRLDLLCLDRQGHVVVVELKRTDTADYADLQALRYVAMIGTLTIGDAANYLANSRQGREMGLDEAGARAKIIDFMADVEDGEGPSELQSDPRIIIASSGFSKEVLTTANFLCEHEINVTCISLTAYSMGDDRYILVPDRVLPIQELGEHLIRVRRKEEARQSGDRARLPPMLNYLVEKGQIKPGDVLFLKHRLPPDLASHYKEDDPMFRATVVIEGGSPSLRWEKDKNLYSPSELVAKVLREFRFGPPWRVPPNGSNNWGSSKENLWEMARRIRDERAD